MKRRYLVCYDYGQGGVWVFIYAHSSAEIRAKYPELLVAEERLAWMTDEWLARIEARSTYDIEEEPHGFLAGLLEQRKRE